MNHLQILPCTLSDCEAVADVYNTYITPSGHTMDMVLKSGEDIRNWMAGFNDREGLFVLQENGEIVGWGLIKRYSDREGYRFACETAVYLKPAVRGKGYGSLLKKFLIDKCEEWGYHHLVAKIWATNTVSIEYNKKLGYEIVGTQREIGYKNGEWVDVVLMQYICRNRNPEKS